MRRAMARPGDELDNGNVKLVFRRTSKTTYGEALEVEACYRPRSQRPPMHFHPNQSERFDVLEGTLLFCIAGSEQMISAGEGITIPPGIPHWIENPTDLDARATWITRPALETERFFETLYGLARDGKTNAKGVPSLLQVAVIARAYRDEFVLTNPPPLVQSCVFSLLSPIARALGYRGRYEAYSVD
jgi:quercetin dioxygenase-like cupin family protein